MPLGSTPVVRVQSRLYIGESVGGRSCSILLYRSVLMSSRLMVSSRGLVCANCQGLLPAMASGKMVRAIIVDGHEAVPLILIEMIVAAVRIERIRELENDEFFVPS